MFHDHPHAMNGSSFRRARGRATALFLVGTLATGGVLLAEPLALTTAPSAAAAELGPGHGDLDNGLFGYLINGLVALCVQPMNAEHPISGPDNLETVREGYAPAGKALSALDMAQMGFVSAEWGQLESSKPGALDDRIAAASAYFAVKTLPEVSWNEDGAPSIIRYRIKDPATAERVVDLYRQIAAEAETVTIATLPDEALLTGEYVLDMQADGTGTLTVKTPMPGGVSNIALTGATFDDGQTTKAGARDGDTFAITGTPRDDAPGKYTVSAAGTISAEFNGERAYLPELEARAYETQQTVAMVGKKAPRTASVNVKAEATVSLGFAPVLTSEAGHFLSPGQEEVLDEVTFGVAEGSQPWRQLSDGTYIPVTAERSIYRTKLPVEGSELPADAELVHEGTTVLADKGPGVYAAPIPSELITEAGWTYFARFTVRQEDQSETARTFLPEGYVATEGDLRPQSFFAIPDTTSKASTVTWGESITDTVTLTAAAPAGSQMVWAAYSRTIDASGVVGDAECRPEQLLWTNEDSPVAIADGSLTVTSPAMDDISRVTYPAGLSSIEIPIDIVHTTISPDRDGVMTEVDVSACGEEGQTAIVKPKPEIPETPLANTGANSGTIALAGGGLLTLAAAVLGADLIRRRKKQLDGTDAA